MDVPEVTGARIIRRLEKLMQQSTLPPETVLNIMRSAGANPGLDPLSELEHLRSEGTTTD